MMLKWSTHDVAKVVKLIDILKNWILVIVLCTLLSITIFACTQKLVIMIQDENGRIIHIQTGIGHQ